MFRSPEVAKHIAELAHTESQMGHPKDGNLWGIYDSGVELFNRIFTKELQRVGCLSFEDLVLRLRQAHPHRPVTGLELAGQGKMFAELNVGGVACCLAHPRFLTEQTETGPRRKGASPGIAYVPGDLAASETWEGIANRFRREAMPHPSLALFSPGARGLLYLPEESKFFRWLTERVLELVDSSQFVFFGETSCEVEEIERQLREIELAHKVETTYNPHFRPWPPRITTFAVIKPPSAMTHVSSATLE